MPQTNHGAIEFLKFPNPQYPGDRTKLIKKWLRDSWARRKIVALQQAVAAIVVPTASTANPQMDGTASPGVSTDYSRADHVHPHDSSKANVATTLAGYGITDAYTKTQVDGMIPSVPSASTANPAMDGTASAGSSTAWARGDHVHPHDTSKADKATTLSGYGITNAYTKTEVDGMIPTVPTYVSAFANDAGYITEQTLMPTTFSTLTPYQSRCTIEAGGFIKIGRIVYVDVTITMATGASTTSFTAVIAEESEIAPLKGAYSILTAVNNTSRTKTTKALVGAGGNILICNASSGELVYITGCYISAS